MTYENEDRLQTVSTLLDDAQRCILQTAFKGWVSGEQKERIERVLKAAAQTASRLEIGVTK